MTFIGAIKKQGAPIVMIPSILRGQTLHHSVAYNPVRNEYLVAFDWDINYDKIPDHVYALRLDTRGNLVDKAVLNFTATLSGWAGGKRLRTRSLMSGISITSANQCLIVAQ